MESLPRYHQFQCDTVSSGQEFLLGEGVGGILRWLRKVDQETHVLKRNAESNDAADDPIMPSMCRLGFHGEICWILDQPECPVECKNSFQFFVFEIDLDICLRISLIVIAYFRVQ